MTFLGKQVYSLFCKKVEHVSLPLSDKYIFLIPHNIHLRLINRTSKLFCEKLCTISRYNVMTLKSCVYSVGTSKTLPTFHQIEVSFLNKTFLNDLSCIKNNDFANIYTLKHILFQITTTSLIHCRKTLLVYYSYII